MDGLTNEIKKSLDNGFSIKFEVDENKRTNESNYKITMKKWITDLEYYENSRLVNPTILENDTIDIFPQEVKFLRESVKKEFH